MAEKSTGAETSASWQRNSVGWCTVFMANLTAAFWAYWGVIEAFHEGWCRPTLIGRLWQTLLYLMPAIFFTTLSTVSIRWPRFGAITLCLFSLAMVILLILIQARFSLLITCLLTICPFALAGMYAFGRPRPRRTAIVIACGIPLLVLILAGAEPLIRVSHRVDDGYRGSRIIQGNGTTLEWAPEGPGWTRKGNSTWEKALEIANHLSDDGLTIMDTAPGIWRLPTRQEIVVSLTRANENAGGIWDPEDQAATYRRLPDKESPLWDSVAPLIYLWTSESESEHRAWIVVYHGGIFPKSKTMGSSSLGFRAVRVAH